MYLIHYHCATYYLLAKEVLRSREVSNILESMSGYILGTVASLFGAFLHLTISCKIAEYRSSTALPLIPPGILTTDPKQLYDCNVQRRVREGALSVCARCQ